ncbi:hypothetical protein CRYUN_Cryun30bG0085300 [Craigia yunnanensis]
MVPVLDQVSSTLKDKIQVVKIDTEKYPRIADKYGIQALPTFIIFKDGKPFDRFFIFFNLKCFLTCLTSDHHEGASSADQLIQRIENSLSVKQ